MIKTGPWTLRRSLNQTVQNQSQSVTLPEYQPLSYVQNMGFKAYTHALMSNNLNGDGGGVELLHCPLTHSLINTPDIL